MATSCLRALLVAALVGAALAPAPAASAHQLEAPERHQDHVVERARSAIGSPYSYGGASPAGFDCSGFTMWVFSGHGAELPHSSSAQFALGDRPGYRRIADRDDLQRGDLVFHDTTNAHVGHVGIYIGSGNFVSATSSGGVQVRSLYDPYYWGERWVGGVRLPATMLERDAAGEPRKAARRPGSQDRGRGRADAGPRRRGRDRWGASRYRPEEWRPHGRGGRP